MSPTARWVLLRHRLLAPSTFRHSHRSISLRPFLSSNEGTARTLAVKRTVVPSTFSRSASSSSSLTKKNDNNDDDLGPEVLLYERSTNKSVALLRSGFFCSVANTLYWGWYVTDFMPLVNASPLVQLHIDPMWGYAGMTMAVAVNAIFIVYPKRFISKLIYRPKMHELVVYTYRLPWMHPSTYATARFPVGDRASGQTTTARWTTAAGPELQPQPLPRKPTDYFRLDTTSDPGRSIVATGDLTTTAYTGHLVVGGSWPRYSLDLSSKQDLVEPEMLLEMLLRPEYFCWDDDVDGDDDDDAGDDYGRQGFRRNKKRKKTSTARSAWRRGR